MTEQQAETLVPHESRVRHCDGPVGTYVAREWAGEPWLYVEVDGVRHVWSADDCEVAR